MHGPGAVPVIEPRSGGPATTDDLRVIACPAHDLLMRLMVSGRAQVVQEHLKRIEGVRAGNLSTDDPIVVDVVPVKASCDLVRTEVARVSNEGIL